MAHILHKLSDTVHSINEKDHLNENPFLYLIQGPDKSVLVDTGVGTENLAHFIASQFGEKVLEKLIIINTHSHFDHVGGNHLFTHLPIYASSSDKEYTLDPDNTLGAKFGYDVKPYRITHWLDHMEKIYLSDSDPNNFVQALHSPGHNIDSLCLWYPKDNRLFVGDLVIAEESTVYANIQSYSLLALLEKSTAMVSTFVEEKEKETKKAVWLSSGHINDSIPSKHLHNLSGLICDINSGVLKGTRNMEGEYDELRFYDSQGQLIFGLGDVMPDTLDEIIACAAAHGHDITERQSGHNDA